MVSSASVAINRMLAVVAGELGTQHNQGSRGTNKYGRWYDQKYGGGKGIYSNGQFCAMGLSWAAEKAGIPTSVLPPHAYTPSGVAWFRSRGRFTAGMKGIRRGDYWYSSCAGLGRVSHVGIVERVHADGSIDCLEFNTTVQNLPPNHPNQRTGGWVARKRRYSACSLGGYARPDYASITPVPEEDIMASIDDLKNALREIVPSIVKEQIDNFNVRGVRRPGDPAARGEESRVELLQEIADTKTTGLALLRRSALASGLELGFVRLDGPDGAVYARQVDGTITPVSKKTWERFRRSPDGAHVVPVDLEGPAREAVVVDGAPV